jgi:hypothetical protein
VAGEVFFECSSCGAVRVLRAALHRLRQRASVADPSVDELAAAAPAARAAPPTSRPKRCVVCRSPLLSHAFGGGNIRVDACERCELVYLRGHDLGAVLREARDGIQMSEEARVALVQERLLSSGGRLSAAELGLSTGALVAVILFLRIVVRTGFSTSAIVLGGVIALGLLVHRRRRFQRQRTAELGRMERLAAAEVFRLEQKERAKGQREPTSAPGAAGPRSPLRSSRPRPCPVCNTTLPPGSSHCAHCDSDFG